MKLSDFDYSLPKELIAQEALPNRTGARLLVLHKETGGIEHAHFARVLEHFKKGDVLVLNNTKVLRARLFGKKESGGVVEALLLKEKTGDAQRWEALLKASGKLHVGQRIQFEGFSAVIVTAEPNAGISEIQFEKSVNVKEALKQVGHMPLPPYINRKDNEVDHELYQTVFAHLPGSVASPTAGLHFDNSLLRAIEAKGVAIVYITLHVGLGTFRPVTVDDIAQHQMHAEFFDLPDETADEINMAKTDGRQIIACGTTCVRTLEACATDSMPAEVKPKQGWTNLFIYPPYAFKVVDAIITNFHLPRTTLLMLVAAFSGKERLERAYQAAIRESYRFYSYGDAMFIIE